MKQRLKLTKQGIEELKQELEKKNEELRNLGKYKNEAAENEGDAWHDNFAFEQTEIKERSLNYEISEMQHQIETAELINGEINTSQNSVRVGSEVDVLLTYSEDDEERNTFILVGGYGNFKENKISLNSPIGKCILGQSEGFKGKYQVNGNIVSVEILEIK